MMTLWLKLAFLFIGQHYRWCVTRRLARAHEIQQQLLLDIVRRNQHSQFGQLHQFSRITDVASFQAHCPVQSYDSLRPGPRQTLTEAVCCYAKTSGTTGASKLLPLTRTQLVQLKRQQAWAMYWQYRTAPAAFAGSMLGIVSCAEEEQHHDGLKIGAVSGMMYQQLPWLLRKKFILPAEILAIADVLTRNLAILRLAVACEDLSYIATANPSTVMLLMGLLHQHQAALCDSIELGHWLVETPLTWQPSAQPKRAHTLRQLFAQATPPRLADIWPQLALLATWSSGNCQIPLTALRAQLPSQAKVMDLGLIASECRMTLLQQADSAAGMPLFTDCFYEFVERDAWENQQATFLTLNQLHIGQQYYVFVTTYGGLYRYDMNDIVQVSAKQHNLPLLTFLQKGRGITNITGEKLSESQLIQAISQLMTQQQLHIPFFMALANRYTAQYCCYIETAHPIATDELAQQLDQKLMALNSEYQCKRLSHRLHPLQLKRLAPGSGAAYRAHRVAQGQKDGQFKPICLIYADTTDFAWEAACCD